MPAHVQTVRRVDLRTGIISTVAGNGQQLIGAVGDGGPATEASFSWIQCVALDSSGNIYMSDAGSSRRAGTALGGAVAWMGLLLLLLLSPLPLASRPPAAGSAWWSAQCPEGKPVVEKRPKVLLSHTAMLRLTG